MPYKDINHQREFQRLRVARRRAEFLSDKSCVDCGSTEQLELDHNVPSERTDHRIWNWSWQRIMAETAKCSIRCHTCHVKRHEPEQLARSLARQIHGTKKRYQTGGCRCIPCKSAGAIANKKYRKK